MHATDGNYTIGYGAGTLTMTQAPLTVAAENAARVQGQANPIFTATYNGFKNTDTDSVLSGLLISSPAVPASAPGNYSFIPSGATAVNYMITYEDGALTIMPIALPDTVVFVSQIPTLAQLLRLCLKTVPNLSPNGSVASLSSSSSGNSTRSACS